MPSSLTDLLNNDLRVIAQQFATITYYCRMLEKRVEERNQSGYQDRAGERVSHDYQINHLRQQLQESRHKIAKLEQDIRDIEYSHANADKRRRVELEKKKEKIDNQKRRIKEQQDQIDVSTDALGVSTVTCFLLLELRKKLTRHAILDSKEEGQR